MRLVVQRVKSASVAVNGKTVSKIGAGLLCLVGLKGGDTARDTSFIADKILRSRLFPDPDSGSNWKRNVVDIEGEILCISQFTLYCRVKRPAKPDFSRAMKTDEVIGRLPPKSPIREPVARFYVLEQTLQELIMNVVAHPVDSFTAGFSKVTYLGSLQRNCTNGQILLVPMSDLSHNFGLENVLRADYRTKAQEMYEGLLQKLREDYVADRIFDGEFGALMDVSLVNDGPVTITVDSDGSIGVDS